MSYDTTLDDVMTPPRGAPLRNAAPGHGPRFKLKLKWLQASRDTFVVVVTLSSVFLASSTFHLAGEPLRGVRQGGWYDALYAFGGATAVQLAGSFLITVACGLVMLALRKLAVPSLFAIGGGLMAYLFVAAAAVDGGVPLIAAAGLALTLAALADLLAGGRWALAWLPAVFVAWAMADASFLLGLLAIACLPVGLLLDARQTLRRFRAAVAEPLFLTSFALLVLCGAMSLAGVGTLAGTLTSDIIALLSAGPPLVVTTAAGMLFFASIVLTGALLRFSRRRIQSYEAVLVIAFAAMVSICASMFVAWALVWVWVAVVHAAALPMFVTRRKASADTAVAADDSSRPTVARGVVAAAVVVVCLFLSVRLPAHGRFSGPRNVAAQPADRAHPVVLASGTKSNAGNQK